jgi:hypothetical protein
MNMQERCERLNRMIESGDVIRRAWAAELMPAWLAELTPWLDDEGSEEAWPGLIRRYARCASHFHNLTDRTLWRVLATIVREAMRHTTDNSALEVCERVAVLYEQAAALGVLDTQAMREAAEAAARVAWAAWAAWAAVAAAWEAARAAREAARAVRAADAAVEAAAWAGEAAALVAVVDRLQDAIMTIIEQDCGIVTK